jgi:hypothetical protein
MMRRRIKGVTTDIDTGKPVLVYEGEPTTCDIEFGIPKIKVTRVMSKHHFVIETDGVILFQSYDKIIAVKMGGEVYLDEFYWKYSKTTSKYRRRFLGEDTKTTDLKIREGKYKLLDLNREV